MSDERRARTVAPRETGARASDERHGRRRGVAEPRPTVRGRGVKVTASAARTLQSGHPWVFRESLLRPLQGVDAGTPLPVLDPDGKFLAWGLAESEGAVALRLFAWQEDERWEAGTWEARIRAAKVHRERFLSPTEQRVCRVIHGESDGFPGLAVDRLGPYLLIYKYSHVVDRCIDELVPLLQAAFEPEAIYLQDRVRPVAADERRPGATLLAGKAAPSEYEVVEDGLTFVVDVTAPVSTGLFLDLREGRRLCERHAANRSVLNLFSFTGAFALRGLRGGATAVVNVDAAARAHARCRQNLERSGFAPDACEAMVGDVFKHLERMRQRKRTFDLVVVDPPPFSRVKGKMFSALRDWRDLMSAVAGVVPPGGLVLAVSNASGLSEHEFFTALGEGIHRVGRRARSIDRCSLPADFPILPAFVEGRYLKIELLQFV